MNDQTKYIAMAAGTPNIEIAFTHHGIPEYDGSVGSVVIIVGGIIFYSGGVNLKDEGGGSSDVGWLYFSA